MWPPPPNMNGERMPLPSKLIAVSIDKDRGSQIALKWTVDHLLARGQTVLLIHVKLKQSANASGQSTSSKSNQNTDEGGSGNIELDQQTKELFLPLRVFCTRKDIQCYDIVLDDTDVARAVIEYATRTGVEVLIVGASTRGGLLRFKAKDIPGGILKGAPDFCTVHVISKSGKISSTRAASRSAPFVHPLRHQLMHPVSTKFAPFDTSTPSSTNSRSSYPGGLKPVCDPPPSTLRSDTMSFKSPFIHRKGPNGQPYEISFFSMKMWPPPPNMNGERMPLPSKLIAVSIDKDRGSQIALKWTVDHLLARGQTVLLIHVKLKQSANASGQSTSSKSNQNTDEGGSGNIELDQQTKELFLPFRVFCTRKDIQCYAIVLDDTDVARVVIEYATRTGVEVLIVGTSTSGGLLRFKAKDIPGGILKGAPDFCTVHVISKSGKISSTRAASRSAPFVHPLRHQLMQPVSTKFAPFDTSTPSSTNSRCVIL